MFGSSSNGTKVGGGCLVAASRGDVKRVHSRYQAVGVDGASNRRGEIARRCVFLFCARISKFFLAWKAGY